METTGVHFLFLCFVFIAFLSLVESNYKLYNSRSASKIAGVQYVESADVREADVHHLLKNKCNFFIVEKTIFYACPKRPTRYPSLHKDVFRSDNENENTEGTPSHSEKFECPFPFGTYPHPKDCRKYFLCIFDKPRTMTCDSSKLYDEYTNECAEKSTVDCGDRTGDTTTKGTTETPGQKTTNSVKTTTKKVEKFKCPYRWGTFPNPDDCSQYYLCLNKRHTLKKCKPTELYDTKKGECENEDKVDCGSRFNPREKTTKPATTTTATTARSTAIETTAKEEITSDSPEQSTSLSSSGDTSDQNVPESSTSIEVSPSAESRTSMTEETESSEEPARSTEEPIITDEDTSVPDEPEPSSEKPVITDEDTSDSNEPELSSDRPVVTDKDSSDGGESELTSEINEYTSESDQPKSTSGKPEITDDDTLDTQEPEVTSEESSEVAEITIKPTEEDSSISQEPAVTDTESEAPAEETTPAEEVQSSLPEDNTKSDEEKPTDGEGETDHTTEEVSTSSQQESTVNDAGSSEEALSSIESKISKGLPYTATPSDDFDNTDKQTETIAEEKITPDVSQSTVDSGDISSRDEVEISPATSSATPEIFVCPKKKGNFPHKDCSLYYQCREGSYKTVECPRGTLFNLAFGMCDNEDDVDCGDRKRPDGDTRSTVADISSRFPTDRQMTETIADIDIKSEFSKSFENTDKTVDYTSSDISETISSSDYNTEKTDSTFDFDNNDLTSKGSTENFETSSLKTDGTIGTESTTDYETSGISTGSEVAETSESHSIHIFSTKEISDSAEDNISSAGTENYSKSDTSEISSTGDRITKEEISSTDRESIETSETYTTVDYDTEDTSHASEGSSTVDHVTKAEISSTDRENIETSADYNTEESTSVYSAETTSEIYTTADYSTKDTGHEGYSTQDEVSMETTTDFISTYELSTQYTTDVKEHHSTSKATEVETEDSSSDDQSTSYISETTHPDSQETTADYTDVSSTGIDDASQTHLTDDSEETISTSAGDNEISTKDIATFGTKEPSSQNTADGKDTSDRISTVGTTAENIIKDLTSSELPVSTKEESTSFMPSTTQSNSDKSIVSETTETESYDPLETTRSHFPSSTETTSITSIPVTFQSTEKVIPSTLRPKDLCLANDKTCIIDDDGNVFRCPKPHGHFPHPTNMSKFLHCDNFRIHVIDCPAGLRFDPKHNICTWAAAGKE